MDLPVVLSDIYYGSATETYDELEVTITAPDTTPAFIDYDVEVYGRIIGGLSSDIFSYAVYENLDWAYDVNHMVDKFPGPDTVMIDEDGFNWGFEYNGVYTLNRAPGVYKYTFIFGDRRTGHGWYDLAVDTFVIVGESDDEDEDVDDE